MTNSFTDLQESWVQVVMDSYTRELPLRTALLDLTKFIFDDTPTPSDAVLLFWNVCRPRTQTSSDESQKECSSQDHRFQERLYKVILDCLDWMYEKYRVPYEPDSEDDLDQLVIYLHIAAARAFQIRRVESGQWSEESLSCLKEVDRVRSHLFAQATIKGLNGLVFSVHVHPALGPCLVELSRVFRNNGEYARALHYLAKGVQSNLIANLFVQEGEAWDYRDSSPRLDDSEVSGLRTMLTLYLTDMQLSLEEGATFWEPIVADGKKSVDDWVQVVEDCAFLAGAEFVTGIEEEIWPDNYVTPLTWTGFWYGAEKWASAQLSPSEYRKMRDQDEKDAAEKRLRNYFFGSSWPSLPERAQQALITADSNWHSPQRIRQASILNELLRASEEMCHNFIWEMLENNDEASKHLIAIEHTIVDHGRSEPNIRDYIRACKQTSFRRFLCRSKVNKGDIRFMTEDLPKSMTRLTDARNDAEHESGVSVSRDTLASFFNGFLGIGQPGILPQLARIGRKLQISTD